jgi:hypothetical protein
MMTTMRARRYEYRANSGKRRVAPSAKEGGRSRKWQGCQCIKHRSL